MDIRDAIGVSFSWSQFVKEMEKRGYTWKLNRKYPALKTPDMERYVRLRSLGKGYGEAEIREKILRLMDKEIPHGIAVAIEKMKERPDGSCLDVDATIYCERESHKGMVIGKGGAMLKKIATFARQDMERFFGIKVNLHTWVKVKEDWRNREGLIHNFGLDNE
mgnify:CR=1 FL=1